MSQEERDCLDWLKRAKDERNHQGKGNVLLFPCGEVPTTKQGPSIRCHERLGGLLKYYHRKAA